VTLASLATATVIVDVAIVCTVLEALVLVSIHRWGRHGLAPRDYLLNLLSGLCLMLALRAALGAEWSLIALFLSASGAVHVSDMVARLRRARNHRASQLPPHEP
jgi:hypothetical protein